MQNLLKSQLRTFEKLFGNYEKSLEKMKKFDFLNSESAEDFEPVDAFFSRFGRTVDFLFQQIFRTIFKIETLSDGNPTLRELIFLMGKIGIVQNIDDVIELKELRNEITHEYINSDIQFEVEKILKLEEKIFNLVKNVRKYGEEN